VPPLWRAEGLRCHRLGIAMESAPDILDLHVQAVNMDQRRSLIAFLKIFRYSKMLTCQDIDLILDVCERCIMIKDGRVSC
jgi:cobalt/nickel transport system ATP-binding protein